MALSRQWYVETIRHWIAGLEDRWDERQGYYRVPQSTRCNGMLLPPLLVLLGEGEEPWRERIARIASRIVQEPPYDARYRYFNWNMHQTGGEIHQAGCMTQVGLSFVLRHAPMLQLLPELRAEIEKKVHDSLERLAEFGRHGGESEISLVVDEDGTPVDISRERAEKIAKGLPECFGRLRQIGPDNQMNWELRAEAYAWKATGDPDYLDFMDLSWKRVLREDGLPHAYCFSEDSSFIYTRGNPLWNYCQSMYDIVMFCQFADAVRIMRQAGRSNERIERFMKNWGAGVFTRSFLSDGASNMVFNTYGWERSVLGCTHGMTLGLHAVIAAADLAPYQPGALKAIYEQGARRLREWDFRYPFPPDLGALGWHSAQVDDRSGFPYEIALMLLDNAETIEVEPAVEPAGIPGCLSSLAWKEGNFVMQTPVYHATVIGSSPGYDGTHGIPMSGGEFMVRIPNGDYLLPLSANGRASLGAVVDGEELQSFHVTRWNADAMRFAMSVRLRDGTVLPRETPPAFGPLLYDPRSEGVTLAVSFGNDKVQLTRAMVFALDHIEVTDRLFARRPVTVAKAYSRLPIITMNPRGILARVTAKAGGKEVCIQPPYFMGFTDADYLHHDQEFAQSLRRLELLRVDYDGSGYEIRAPASPEIRLGLSAWSWQENRRMRADGKNLDYLWIYEPTRLEPGGERTFAFELWPIGGASAGAPG